MGSLSDRRQAHEEALPTFPWLTVSDLVARWRLSRATVCVIPAEELPYKEFGRPGSQRARRRYHPDDVSAYEGQRRGRAA
jgi:hypothetical protein